MNEPWLFEPTDPEGICDPAGLPWAHAVRGRKPQRPTVMGYGHCPDDAERDATHKAHQQDAREMIGERGEVKAAAGLAPLPCDVDFIGDRRYLRKLGEQYGWPIMESADSAIVKIDV